MATPTTPRPTTLPNPVEPIPEVAEDEAPEEVAAEAAAEADPAVASPEDVLDRLTQYATSARAGDQLPEPEPASEPVPPPASEPVPPPVQAPVAEVAEDQPPSEDFNPVGDDLLPRGKSSTRRSKPSRKRRP